MNGLTDEEIEKTREKARRHLERLGYKVVNTLFTDEWYSDSSGGKKKAPEGYKPNPEYIETKSKRVQLLVQPSVYEAVKAKAKARGISTNEAINEALREYTER